MEDHISKQFKALSDENRLKVLELLIQGETCGCTLIDKLPITQPTLSYHLKVLTEAKLTTSFKDGNWVKHTVDLNEINKLIDFLVSLKEAVVTCKS